MMRRMACLGGLIWILWAIPAQAACTGSGTTWSCPAGASTSDVNAAISSSSDGATITFADGSYNWSSPVSFSLSHGDTLLCQTEGGCTIAANGTFLNWPGATANNTFLYRFSGFVINDSGTTFPIYACPGGTCPGKFTSIRIDHNTFNVQPGTEVICFCDGTSAAVYYGVIDHNTVNSSGSAMLLIMVGNTSSPSDVSPLGTANNMFVEDNTMNLATMTNAGEGCMDSWGEQAIVWRHNTTTNCLVTAHGVTHQGGPSNIEFYNNSTIVNSGSVSQGVQDCYRCFHHQGSGEIVAFNNSFTPYSGHNSDALAVGNYRDSANAPSVDGQIVACDGTVVNQSFEGVVFTDGNRTPSGSNYGYPCWHQAGRDMNGNYKPMYAWNNYFSDTRSQVSLTLEDLDSSNNPVVPNGSFPPNNCNTSSSGNCDYNKFHLQYNREAYNAVSPSAQTSPTSPFNGTTGMGFGTLANRPTTCTSNSTESGAGVGYFATDDGAQGTLYTCSAANTWTVYYTPYIYPHPLVSGEQPPAPPTNLQDTVN